MPLRGISAFHGGLDVQLRAASTAIPTTPTQLILPTIAQMQGGIGYDTITGIYTAPTTAVYDSVLQFNVNAAAPGQTLTVDLICQLATGAYANITISGAAYA